MLVRYTNQVTSLTYQLKPLYWSAGSREKRKQLAGDIFSNVHKTGFQKLGALADVLLLMVVPNDPSTPGS